MSKTRRGSLLGFLEEVHQRAEQQGKHRKALNLLSLRRSLAQFLKSLQHEDVDWKGVDQAFVKGYEAWLMGKQLARSTTVQYLHDLKWVMKVAEEDGLWKGRVMLNKLFEGMMGEVEKRTEKPYVEKEVISRLWNLDIRQALAPTRRGDGKVMERRVERIGLVRDCFVFCFCCQGMDFLDLGQLKKENVSNGSVRYVRRKTGREVSVEILPMMREIMDRHWAEGEYVFPILQPGENRNIDRELINAQHDFNKWLGVLSGLMGKDVKLTSQMPGYSWAAAAYRGGMSIPQISQAMGYSSDLPLRDFLLSLDNKEELDKRNRMLMDSVFGEN